MTKNFDIRIENASPLVSPEKLKQETPLEDSCFSTIVESRRVIRDIINKRDSRILGIIGPCSIHDPETAFDYASRIAELRKKVDDRIFLIMRVYFENRELLSAGVV